MYWSLPWVRAHGSGLPSASGRGVDLRLLAYPDGFDVQLMSLVCLSWPRVIALGADRCRGVDLRLLAYPHGSDVLLINVMPLSLPWVIALGADRWPCRGCPLPLVEVSNYGLWRILMFLMFY